MKTRVVYSLLLRLAHITWKYLSFRSCYKFYHTLIIYVAFYIFVQFRHAISNTRFGGPVRPWWSTIVIGTLIAFILLHTCIYIPPIATARDDYWAANSECWKQCCNFQSWLKVRALFPALTFHSYNVCTATIHSTTHQNE